jgi:WD40 repeat protein
VSTDSVRLWDVASGHHIKELKLPKSRHPIRFIKDATIAHDGARVVTTVTDGYKCSLHLWNIRDEAGPVMLESSSTRGVFQPMFSHDSKCVAGCAAVLSTERAYTVQLWDGVTGARIRTAFNNLGAPQTLAFSPDSKRLVSGGSHGYIHFIVSGTQELSEPFGERQIRSVLISRNGRWVLCLLSPGQIKLWDVANGVFAWSIQQESSEQDDIIYQSIAISSTGNAIV